MEKMNVQFLHLFTIFVSMSSTLQSTESFTNYQEIINLPFKNIFDVDLDPYPLQTPSKFSSSAIPQLEFLEIPKEKGPQYPLFTPNSVYQRPETVGQIEEYKKALAEEAEEKEKENENGISSNLENFVNFNGGDEHTKSTHYVDVKADTFKYNYRV